MSATPTPPLAAGEPVGPALLVELVKAARALVSRPGWGLANLFDGEETSLAARVAELDVALQREAEELNVPEAGHWEPATWGAVKPGDRVRLGEHEATVERATSVTSSWVGGHRGVPAGTTESYVAVWLKERPGQDFKMKPSGPVDIWRAALEDWAAQAWTVLFEAGLNPEAKS